MFNGMFINAGSIDDQLSKKHHFDAGLDLRVDLHKKIKMYEAFGSYVIEDETLEEIKIPPQGRAMLNTSVNIAIPQGYVGLIWDRSGLAANYGITIMAGCIDSNYRGDIKVVLYNTSWEDYIIHNHDRIAQLLTLPVALDLYKEVESLNDTDRGTAGIGSSGYD